MNQAPFKVYQKGRHVETVYFDADVSSEEVRRSLINHDGYPSNISVRASRKTRKNPRRVQPVIMETAMNTMINTAMTTMWGSGVRRDAKLRAMTLGVLVARWADWEGSKIVMAFLSALEDGNYHTEAAAVAKLFNMKV